MDVYRIILLETNPFVNDYFIEAEARFFKITK